MVTLLLVFLGSFIEDGAVLILMTPILVPIAVSLGIDPVHFGVVMVLNLMIGAALPPVGMSLFVTAHVSGISVERMYKAILPRSEEHTSELQSLMRNSYAVFCLKKKKDKT